MPAISSEISHVAGFRLATLAYTQPHAVINTNLQKRIYTTKSNSLLITSSLKPDCLFIYTIGKLCAKDGKETEIAHNT